VRRTTLSVALPRNHLVLAGHEFGRAHIGSSREDRDVLTGDRLLDSRRIFLGH